MAKRRLVGNFRKRAQVRVGDTWVKLDTRDPFETPMSWMKTGKPYKRIRKVY
jgi:hypothetical protein